MSVQTLYLHSTFYLSHFPSLVESWMHSALLNLDQPPDHMVQQGKDFHKGSIMHMCIGLFLLVCVCVCV